MSANTLDIELPESLSLRLANKQLSGAQKVKIDLNDYLFKPSSYLHRFSSYPIRLGTHLQVTH